MPDFEVVKTTKGELRGYTQRDHDFYLKFKRFVKALEPGEFVRLSYHQARNPKFHRKFFAMLKHAFDHWEPERARKRLTYKGRPIEKDFDQFRRDVLIRAGFYRATYDHRGRVHLDAESIAFGNMTEERFEVVYEGVLKVLLEDIFTNYTRKDLERVIEELQRFGEGA